MTQDNYWTRLAAQHPRRHPVRSAFLAACAGTVPAATTPRLERARPQ
ncbi:MAG TPA: hypothetical protein VFD32_05290 [Dehalococcoidia bacterium]|nr:hypothetical protein [Dehalococcoidia bacterium]